MAKKKTNNKRVGYTWYPKDWATSERVARLNPAERGVYRELIDLAYLNENRTRFDEKFLSRRLNCSPKSLQRVIEKLTNVRNLDNEPLIEIVNGIINVPACTDRINLIKTLASNGMCGGRPPRNNGEYQGEKENQNDTPLVIESETKEQSQIEIESKIETIPKGIEGGVSDSSNPPPPPEKNDKGKKKLPHLFCESEIFDKVKFAAAFEETNYADANFDYYHEIINNWSNSKSNKKNDWVAATRNWMLRDKNDGKFKSATGQPKQQTAHSAAPVDEYVRMKARTNMMLAAKQKNDSNV